MSTVAAAAPKRKKHRIYESKGEPYFQAFLVIFFALLSITFLYPYWHVLVNSFTTPDFASAAGFRLWPQKFSTDAYRHMLSANFLWSGYKNTLTKRDLPLRGLFTSIILVTMFVSGGMIPTYLLVNNTLKMRNSFFAIILPHCISTSHVIIARNYFMSLPNDLEEAATIDGANSWQVLWRIMLPLSGPILATISLWVIVSNWNAYFNCLLYITDPNKFVLQVVLRRIILTDSKEMTAASEAVANTTDTDIVTLRAASIMLATVPILCVYPFLQKYFVKGVLIGSLKG